MKKLPPRLEKIASLVTESEIVADIGTDHGCLPAALIERGIVKKVIASDIAPGPLKRAEETLLRRGVTDNIELRLGFGLDTVRESDGVDTIIIAGMGGETIAGILEHSPKIVGSAKLIITQPMSALEEFRTYIYGAGYSEIREYLALEKEKIYNIFAMSPVKTRRESLSPIEALAGRDILNTRPEHFDKYIRKIISSQKTKAASLSRSSSPEAKAELGRTKKLLKALEIASEGIDFENQRESLG